jgi:hypothetical protein
MEKMHDGTIQRTHPVEKKKKQDGNVLFITFLFVLILLKIYVRNIDEKLKITRKQIQKNNILVKHLHFH